MDDLHGITKTVRKAESEPLAMKRRYEPDHKIDEITSKLNRLDIRSPESLQELDERG